MDSSKVIVGDDGSPGGLHALEWAAQEAVARRVPLHVVVAADDEDGDDTRAAADAVQARALAHCADRHPDLAVTATVEAGPPAGALLRACADAALLVVGGSGHGGRLGRHLGSVPAAVVRHAACPVAVVRLPVMPHEQRWGGETVVGIDGSERDEQVLAAAFAAADHRAGDLTILHAWGGTPNRVATSPADGERDLTRQEGTFRAHQLVDTVTDRWAAAHPTVRVGRWIVHDGPIHALLSRSERASLLVLGAVGGDAFPSMLLGPVAATLVSHAVCPVLVVRG